MEIIVNQEKQIVPENSTVSSILKEMNFIDKAGFAVALNQQVVPKNKWDTTALKEGDKVLLIEISQGG
ncbi:MAG: sulfur carrier protein ThiS [Bacteroidota bacterium]